MRTHLNTLYVTSDDAYLRKDGEAVAVRVAERTALRVPLHNLEGIVCFGWRNRVSPALMHAATGAGLSISYLSPSGRLRGRVLGYTAGNVLLRRTQYRRADDEAEALSIAIEMVAAKIANCRIVLLRAAREAEDSPQPLRTSARRLAQSFTSARKAHSLANLRGIEGNAAATYFSAFPHLLRGAITDFPGRKKYPALDPVNSLLSFCYGLLRHDIVSAAETVGLDPAVGFLHRDRPGRPGLALDLMEEFRPVLADRLALTLLNRRQLNPKDFETTETGVTQLRDKARKKVIASYQERKRETVRHPFLNEKMSWGLAPHIQARLLSRLLRGDIDAYPPFYWR